MEKYKSLRNAVIALLIYGLLAYVCYGAIFIVLSVAEGGTFFLNHMKEIAYVMSFQKDYYILLGINCFALLAILVVEFVLMITVSVLKGKATTVLPFVLSVFSTLSLVEVVANLSRYTAFDVSETGKTGYVALFENMSKLPTAIMAIAVLVMTIISVIISLTAFLLAFIYTLLYKKPRRIRVIRRKAIKNPSMAKKAEPRFEKEPEPEPNRRLSNEELVELIRQVIREEQGPRKEEPEATQERVLTSPLVVQYFSGLNNPQPEEEEEKVEEQPEPVIEEPVPEEPVVEETPVVEPEPEVVPEKKVIIRIPFQDRMSNASDEMKKNYNEIKNEIMAYGVHSRISNSGDTFRLHRKTFVKLTIAGKSLKLYFALNPADYMSSTFPIGNAGDKNIYSEIPLIFKVKSGLSVKRCKQLIYDVMSQNNLEQGEVGNTDWVSELIEEMKEGKIENDDVGEDDED